MNGEQKFITPDEASALYMPEGKSKGKFDYMIYIGRFQPFHKAHFKVVETACALADKVIILCGSANMARSVKNPWTFPERQEYIKESFQNTEYKDKILIAGIDDHASNNEWKSHVQNVVNTLTHARYEDKKIALIGHCKDQSSWYLNNLPWEFFEVGVYKDNTLGNPRIDSTNLRNLYFAGSHDFALTHTETFPPEVIKWLNRWRRDRWEIYNPLQEEYRYLRDYKKSWKSSPFPPMFITVDSVVFQKGHILLVQRARHPGKNQWAMPGGFIGEYESLRESAIRELKEETRLKVPEKILLNSIKSQLPIIFDNPARSQRGRTITNVFVFDLDADPGTKDGLSEVRGGDDAKDAKWVPLDEFMKMSNQMFEDHYFIGEHFIKQL